jgi:uncharacterized protein (TIGR02453 family)
MTNALGYLGNLQSNNNREWYTANKEPLKAANGEFELLVAKLMFSIGEFDTSILPCNPKELTFKLVRDTRFSHDKSPYTPRFRACISAGGKMPVPVGYYISIAPGNRSFLGGGLFASMFTDATSRIRDYIADHGDEWEAIVNRPDFSSRFQVKGESLKKVPKEYDPSHPQAAFLKNKSWYLEYPVSDEWIQREDFAEKATSIFLLMKPFNDFLNLALKGFRFPKR